MKNLSTWLRFRIFLVFGVFVFFFGVIFLRAFHIQVVEGGALEELAENQHRRVVKVESKRGGIFDRNLNELAVSLEVDSVFVQPARVEGVPSLAAKLAPVLSMDRAKLEMRLGSARRFTWLKRQVDLPPLESAVIRDLKGVGIVKESRRFYPNRHLAANLIGFAGIDEKGLEGIELYHDRFLRGASQKVVVDKDARGRQLVFEDIAGRSRGMDVVLTIDRTIQYIAEKALKKAVDKAGATGGMVVVMDPATGEVLAMATVPTFDPNDFRSFTPGDWRNRSVTDAFEPGSTLKAFLLAAVLEEGVLNPDDIIFCENGSYELSDRVFHDARDHGWLSLAQVVKYSSNIGAVKVGAKLGRERYYRYLDSFGFGTRTGVDLPGEAKGALSHYRNWSDVSLATISFGQGVSVTALQLTSALSSIANGGYLMRPYVVKSIKAPDGRTVLETNPVIVRRVLKESTAKAVTGILESVTESGGTGELAGFSSGPVTVAGKSGTAQKPDLTSGGYVEGRYISSFVGFVPAKEPRLSILVVIDEPQGVYYGGLVAAPVFKEIAGQALSYMGIYTGGSHTSADGRSVVPGSRAFLAGMDGPQVVHTGTLGSVPTAREGFLTSTVPDFSDKTMRVVLRMARERSLEVDVSGSGRAFKQSPPAGTAVAGDVPVSVWFQ